MNFIKLEGLKVIYYLVLLITFVASTVSLLRSAKESLRRTGGRRQSVIDEVPVGSIVLIAFTITAQIEPLSIISFLTKPLKWIWGLVLKVLRFVGVKIQRATMKSTYNHTAVETYKQKLYIPYIGTELNGWEIVLVVLGGLLSALIPIDTPAYHLFGSLGILLSTTIATVLGTGAVMLLTEIDREGCKDKLTMFYYRDMKNYRILYDSQGHVHRLSKKREGGAHRCVR